MKIMFRRLAILVLVWIAASQAACTRDNPPKPTTENDPNTASVSTGTASVDPDPAPLPSAVVAPSAVPSPVRPFERPPRWISDTPQPAVPSALFARGLTGPINDTFEGMLVCQVKAPGTHWDFVVPFLGSDATGYADIRVQYESTVVFLPENTPSGTAVFAGMTITKDTKITLDVDDADTVTPDPIAKVSLDASHGFPMEAKTNSMTLVCRGVPRSALTAQIKPREAALERALLVMEKLPVSIDVARPDTNQKGIDGAQKAARELAAYLGFADPILKSAITRITAVETSQGSRYAALIDAEITKHPPSEFQSLPSGRVRCHPTKNNVVEVEVGARALKYEWIHKNLGPLQFRFISKAGVEIAPAFDRLYVDDKIINNVDAKIPAKGKVDVHLQDTSIDDKQPYAIVVREGAKRVYLCMYAL